MRDADVADVATRARGSNRLSHGLRGADALEHCLCADTSGEVLDAGDPFISALGHDVGRSELSRELLPWPVTAHRDDALGPELLRGEDGEQPDRTVTHDDHRHPRLDVRRVRREPAGAQDI